MSLIGDRPIVTIEAIGDDGVGKRYGRMGRSRCRSMRLLSERTDHERRRFAQGHSKPSDRNIEESMGGNLCRCGTYGRICEAIKTASQQLK